MKGRREKDRAGLKSAGTASGSSLSHPPHPPTAAGVLAGEELSTQARVWVTVALAVLLGIVGLRMTMTESLRDTITMKTAAIMAAANPTGVPTAPAVGPGVTIGLAVIVFACAGVIVLGLSGGRGRMSAASLLGLGVIAIFLALGIASTFQAANRFVALVGTLDIAMAMIAGWAVCVACSDRALGLSGRRLVLMLVAALLAAWIAKAFLQRFDEIPQLREFYKENKEAVLRQQGLKVDDPNDPGVKLWEGRLFSGEVTGFVTFSNNVAAGLIGMVAAGLATFLVCLTQKGEWSKRTALEVTSAAVVAILAVTGLLVIVWTNSRGGLLMGVAVAGVILAGYFLRKQIGRFRWVIAGAVLAVMVAGAAAVVGYGISHDNLRDKSMTFRWFYWTGAAPMVKQSPMLGIGAANFGDYYLTTKRPAAPEDVKDPHSTFVRVAAELGIPAAALFAGLIGWYAYRTITRRLMDAVEESAGGSGLPEKALLALFLVMCVAWWIGQLVIACPEDAWYVYLAMGYAIVSVGAGGMAWVLTRDFTTGQMRIVQAGTLAGAVGMLLYDQINMGLVSGPVAMFFWVLLGFAGSSAMGGKAASGAIVRAAGAAILALTAVLAATVWVPIVRQTFAWDPAPYEMKALRALGRDTTAAKVAVDKAAALSPRSVDVLRLQMRVWSDAGLPTADLLRKLLAIDASNARPRVEMVLNNEALLREERVRYLEEALAYDAALAPDEPKRLSKETIAEIQKRIGELKGAAK